MFSLGQYEQRIRKQFADLKLPPDGVTVVWMASVKSLRALVEEATLFHGMPIILLVCDLEAHLDGSALYAWKMRDGITEICDAVKTVETHGRASDNLYTVTASHTQTRTFPALN
jgi:hypothetical protein